MKYGDLLLKNECFGQVEMIQNCRRLNTVICVEDAELLTLNKAQFYECKQTNLFERVTGNKYLGFGIKEINILSSSLKEKTGERPDLKNKLLLQEENKKRMVILK